MIEIIAGQKSAWQTLQNNVCQLQNLAHLLLLQGYKSSIAVKNESYSKKDSHCGRWICRCKPGKKPF